MGPITYSNPPVEETAPGIEDAAAHDSAEQAQLSFFDAEAPPKMNTQQPDSENSEMPIEADASPAPSASDLITEFRAPATADVPESLGSRLRAAREARGMRCDEAAHRLKLPLATIQALEADRYERIGEGIYLRGYLTKYLQLLELPRVLAERALNAQEALPPLVTSGTVSRPRYLFQRYSVSALYLILTGVIIVPAVLLAMRGGFEPSLAQITPLDTPEATAVAPTSTPTANSTTATDSATTTTLTASLPAATPSAADETPLVASLTPFPASKHEANDTADSGRTVADKVAESPSRPGAHLLRLSLTVPSWVEIIASDGEKLEFGLLPAGAVRSYSSNKAVDVRLGNSSGATIEIDGKTQDLTPFRHANVAHFKLSGGEVTISHSGG